MDRERAAAIERRCWRLAFLVTGSASAATVVADRVMQGRLDPEGMEPGRLDRLIVQQARGVPARVGITDASLEMPAAALSALRGLLSLAHQPREAWVLSRVDELDELRMSQAMDCSRTAARNHLSAGDERMRAILGADLDTSAAALRAFADSLDPGPIMRRVREAQRHAARRRLVKLAAVAGLIVLLGLLAWLRLTRSAGPSGPPSATTGQSPPPSSGPATPRAP
ncbi:MAG: hypothetical protein JNM80_03415 [Phycisphaerae bacterium]|nr:hypothetical protein [Phycisphaerae bacterium]